MSASAGWRWTARGLGRAAGIAVVALSTGAALGYLVSHEPPPHDSHGPIVAPPSPIRAELALLAPLHEGSTLLGFDVAEIHPVGADGVLHIACRSPHATVSIQVTVASDAAPDRYAVTYTLANATTAEGDQLAAAIAAILKTNAGVPPPPALRSRPTP